MVPTKDELRPVSPSVMAAVRDIPLIELSALSSDVLGRTIGRVLPASTAKPAPVAAFQSSL
jgi:FXSXX-COOH protein